MERSEIIFIIGIVLALIWMLCCVLMEGKKKTYLIWAGAIIDIILWAVSRNLVALFGGILTGIVVGSFLTPCLEKWGYAEKNTICRDGRTGWF